MLPHGGTMPAVTQMSHLPQGVKGTRFTLRDDNHQHYHRRVSLGITPLYLRLYWRASVSAPVHHIGIFRLDLPALLRDGYIRPERALNSTEVRIRLYRADDGYIYVQTRTDAPRLLVGRAPQ